MSRQSEATSSIAATIEELNVSISHLSDSAPRPCPWPIAAARPPARGQA